MGFSLKSPVSRFLWELRSTAKIEKVWKSGFIVWIINCSLNLEEILSLTAVASEFLSRNFAVLSSVYVVRLMWLPFICLKVS